MALQLHINVSLNRPPDRTWRRPPGRPRTSGSTSYETIPPVRLETSGDVLSTVDMVVQRRDGPRRYATMMVDDTEMYRDCMDQNVGLSLGLESLVLFNIAARFFVDRQLTHYKCA